jgi:tRNA(fMet)-specific endonuclease VapC
MIANLALDTNAYTELARGNSSLASYVKKSIRVGVPIIVLGEIQFGALNGEKVSYNLSLLRKFLATPRVEILSIDQTTTRLFGEIATELRRIGKPIQQNDIWIAAICKQHEFTLATNDKGFNAILGLEVINF